MPMTTTHALLPLAAAVAVARRPVPWTLIAVAAIAAAAPDVDGLSKHFLGVSPHSVYGHRGAAHSLTVAIAAGLVAALCHKRLGVRTLTAGLVVGGAMASHGLLDMMTDAGQGVAYFWPFSSARFFLDWRPIPSSPVYLSHLAQQAWVRFLSDLTHVIVPIFALALAIRGVRATVSKPRSTS